MRRRRPQPGRTSLASSRALPAVCFASWSDPDRAFQEKHFGKTVLSGGELAEYVIWYRLLKPEEANEWDRFVNGLKPGPDLKAAVEAFRFSTDPKPDPKKPKEHVASLADTPRRLIVEWPGSKRQRSQVGPMAVGQSAVPAGNWKKVEVVGYALA